MRCSWDVIVEKSIIFFSKRWFICIDINKKVLSKIRADVSKNKNNVEKVDYEKGIKFKMIFIYFVIVIITLLSLILFLDTLKYNLSNVS